MKKLIAVIAFGALFSSAAFAQTKKIAHRSHSGKNAAFNVKEEGNFGLPTDTKTKTAKDTGAKKATSVKPDTATKPTDKRVQRSGKNK